MREWNSDSVVRPNRRCHTVVAQDTDEEWEEEAERSSPHDVKGAEAVASLSAGFPDTSLSERSASSSAAAEVAACGAASTRRAHDRRGSDDAPPPHLCRQCRPRRTRTASPMGRGPGPRGGAPRLRDTPPPPWRKVLYERQPFEDNYVDPLQFLQDLRQNENVKNYHYADVVMGTFAIIQQISVVVIFVFVFAMAFTGTMNHYSLLYIDMVLILAAWVMFVQFHLHSEAAARADEEQDGGSAAATVRGGGSCSTWRYMWGFLRQVVGLGTILVLLSPILCTLTVTYNDDTIVALSIFTMTLHVITADYGYLNAYTTRYQPNLSMNAATFGVILMASRIPSPLESGSLIAFGAICFSLSPIARHLLRRYSLTAHVGITFLLFGLSAGCLLQIPILAFLYVTVITMTGFVIPHCFVVLHGSVKYQINGPWDEAKPTNSAAAAEWANAGLLT